MRPGHPRRQQSGSRSCALRRDRSMHPSRSPHGAEVRHAAVDNRGPVGPGSLPTQGSHRPVRARIRAYGSSADRFATPEGSPWQFVRARWTCVRTSMCSACFPRSSLPADASLPFTGSSGASSPASTVLSKRYDFLPPIPPHFVAFAWRYLRLHSFSSLPGGRVRRRSLELVTRYLRPGLR